MKVLMIVGNGFNYMVESWIRNYPDESIPSTVSEDKQSIADKIKEITHLWAKFNIVFNDIKAKNRGISDEELIRIIYAVIDLFSTLPGLKKIMTSEQLNSLKSLFNNFLLDKIIEIAQEFSNYHQDTGYKNIKRLFPTFGKSFEQMLANKNVNEFHIYSTNYDGILDTLLTDYPRNFIFQDGFGNMDSDELLEFYDYNINHDKIICHIHGSYLYKRHFGKTHKLKNNCLNTDPIMIFNNPDLKEVIIRRDNVLNTYFELLEKDLINANKLVIFGNSMTNEPHIKKAIKNYGNRENLSLYVCSPNPIQIKTEIEPFFNYDITEINTSSFSNMNEFFIKINNIL